MTGTRLTIQRSRQCSGFTLAELLLSIAIVSLISAVASAMMYSVSYGTESEAGRHRANVKKSVIRTKLNAAFRASKMVLAKGEDTATGIDYLVLWMGDTKPNGSPNLSELRRFEYDRNTLEISA